MRQKVIACSFAFLLIVSLALIAAGFLELMQVDSDIKNAATIAETNINSQKQRDPIYSLGSNDSNYNLNTPGAIALLTFHTSSSYQIAVFEGITKETLRFGAARASGSAYPCQEGNCVLFGHRDSAFRAIPKLKTGDSLELETTTDKILYRVTSIRIASPDDPTIFTDSDKKKLTLVTCYPFTFIGPAPERCIVESFEAP